MMKFSIIQKFCLLPIIFMGMGLVAGCQKAAAPAPSPLALEEIAPAMEKEFKNAPATVKDLANDAVNTIKAKDFIKAVALFQSICGLPSITESQRNVATRSLMTVNDNIREAALTKADPEAAKMIEMQIRYK